jgi:hypothetical protein
MKSKFLSLILTVMGFVILGQASAQSYDKMPIEIRKKMDDNKQKGLPLKTGIWVDYELTIDGVTNAQTAAEFESFMRSECGLVSFRFDPVTLHVNYTVPAEYDLDGIAPKIKGSKFNMGQFFQERYHI